ncbi:MAG TPA: hypothetical protein VFI65_32840 [Streptosporangiaceae bacterium]|nr:hypothetical protein [Streptosporangiaceae bacterium]
MAVGAGREVIASGESASLGTWGRLVPGAFAVAMQTRSGLVTELPPEVGWGPDSTLFWLDEADGILLLIPRTGDHVLRADLSTGTVQHLERLYRVNVEEFLHVKMWPDSDGTAVLQYERGTIKLDADARVRSHQVINDFADVARRWDPAELPALSDPPAAVRTIGVEATDPRPSASVVIELAIMPRGMVWYGLLGAVYTWAPGDSLTVTVLADGGQAMVDNLAYAPRRPEGRATFGLPANCVGSVVRGFGAGIDKLAALPGGSLRFEYAAHGNVGPSAEVFHGLSAVVTQLVLGSPRPWYVSLCDEFGLHHQM